MHMKTWALSAAAFVLCAAVADPGNAQTYPSRPIRMIVPYSAGTTADVLARAMADHMSERLKQQVYVDNRTGANSIIGAEAAKNSPADGYTFVNLNDAAAALNPVLYPKLPYDTLKDFVPLSFAGDVRMVVVSNPDFQAKDLKQFLSMARANPDSIPYASAGAGSAPHIIMEIMMQGSGTKFRHVPYKGAGPAMVDIMSGTVPIGALGLAASIPQIRAGRLRPLAVTNAARLPALAEVPTMTELGIEGFPSEPWTAFFAPAGIPAPTLARLTSAVVDAINAPEVRSRVGVALDMRSSTPEELRKMVERDMQRYRQLSSKAKLSADN
jgi:tripartite-type tricarboxylate transporter receptor subunit TctC